MYIAQVGQLVHDSLFNVPYKRNMLILIFWEICKYKINYETYICEGNKWMLSLFFFWKGQGHCIWHTHTHLHWAWCMGWWRSKNHSQAVGIFFVQWQFAVPHTKAKPAPPHYCYFEPNRKARTIAGKNIFKCLCINNNYRYICIMGTSQFKLLIFVTVCFTLRIHPWQHGGALQTSIFIFCLFVKYCLFVCFFVHPCTSLRLPVYKEVLFSWSSLLRPTPFWLWEMHTIWS